MTAPRLQALPPVDHYLCLECGVLVEYPRDREPAGIVEQLCDDHFERMVEASTARLSQAARDARDYLARTRAVRPDEDLRALPAHLDPVDASATLGRVDAGRTWHVLDATIEHIDDLTAHLEPLP